MEINIVVCVKPVPDPEKYSQMAIDPANKTIAPEGITTVINPVDRHAIEAALQLREKFGGRVSLVSMAPPNTGDAILEGLAMGADEAYLLSDGKFAGADTRTTSYVLARGIKRAGRADLVLTGTESGDGATAQVSSQLGKWLEIPYLRGVTGFEIQNEQEIYIKTKIEDGYMEWSGSLPMVLAVSREINKPRYTTIMGVMKAKKKPFNILSAADLDLDESWAGLACSPTRPGEICNPQIRRKGEIIKGDKECHVQFIIEKLRAKGINIQGPGRLRKGIKIDSGSLDETKPKLRLLNVSRETPRGTSLEEAELVFCGGWGLGDKTHWDLMEKIAEKLGGAVACTRPPVDEGWAPGEHVMIGTSGKSVRPRIYVGFGISGDAHHTCGMKDAGLIISINRDEQAEIFKVSDYGLVGDIREILPLLAEAVGLG